MNLYNFLFNNNYLKYGDKTMVEINDSVKKDLQQFVGDKFNENTIIAIYKISHDRMTKLYKDSPEKWHALTLKSLETRFKKSNMGASESEFEGYIIGAEDSFDSGERKFKTAIKTFEEDPEQAIADGVTDEDGTPLNETGFNKGEPMEKHNYVTNYIGMASMNSKDPKVFELTVWSKKAPVESQLHKKVRFNAIMKESTEKKYILSSNKVVEFEYDEKIQIPDFDKIKNMFDPEYLMEMENLPKFDGVKFKICMVQGIVMNVVKTEKAHLIKISDFISEKVDVLNIWMPRTFDVSIGEGSTIKILGSVTSKVEENKDPEYFMNFKGFVPVDMISPPEDVKIEKIDFNTVSKKEDEPSTIKTEVKKTATVKPKTAEESLPDSVVASDVDKMEEDIEL